MDTRIVTIIGAVFCIIAAFEPNLGGVQLFPLGAGVAFIGLAL